MYSNLGPLHKNTKSASMKSVPKNGGGGVVVKRAIRTSCWFKKCLYTCLNA